jgi:hypothetical protein
MEKGRVAIGARGASGGLCTLWNTDHFQLEEIHQALNWIMVNLLHLPSGMNYHIVNIYMPNNYWEKVDCWNSLLNLTSVDPLPNIIFVGDFNIIGHLKEKRVGSIVRYQFRKKMDDLISSLDLIDVPPSKGIFTWNNRRVGPGFTAAKMDSTPKNTHLMLQRCIKRKPRGGRCGGYCMDPEGIEFLITIGT